MEYTAALNASQATVDAARQTLLPQLLADAQKKAQTLASAAGLKLGPIKGVIESSNTTGPGIYNNWVSSSGFASGSPFGFASIPGVAGIQYTFFATLTFSVAAQ